MINQPAPPQPTVLFSSVNNGNLPKKFIIISLTVTVILSLIIGIFFWLNRNVINQKPEDLKTPPAPQKQVSAYQAQIEKLDALVAAVNALPKSFDPDIKTEQFSSNKKEVETAANAIKELIAKGDIAGALKKLSGGPYTLKEKIINLGGSPESKFVPQDIKDKYDPQDLVIKKDRVDPRTFPYYLPVVEVYSEIMKL